MAPAPAYAQDKEAWCTDAHMKQMDAKVAKMTDAKMHLSESKAAMKKKDTTGCIEHMEEAHKAMGM
jgi:hypothetical protein